MEEEKFYEICENIYDFKYLDFYAKTSPLLIKIRNIIKWY